MFHKFHYVLLILCVLVYLGIELPIKFFDKGGRVIRSVILDKIDLLVQKIECFFLIDLLLFQFVVQPVDAEERNPFFDELDDFSDFHVFPFEDKLLHSCLRFFKAVFVEITLFTVSLSMI